MIELDKLPAEVASDLLEMWYDMPNVVRTTEVSYKSTRFKYATLDDILDVVREYLKKQGSFMVWTELESSGNNVIVTPLLIHKTGYLIKGGAFVVEIAGQFQQIGSEYKEGPAIIQNKGSAITYARRYAIASILGICSEDDTDGDIKPAIKSKSEANKSKCDPEIWTNEQRLKIDQLKKALQDKGIDITREFLEKELGKDIFYSVPISYKNANKMIALLSKILEQ